MKAEKTHPQFQDTAVSTLLRTDTDDFFQFSSKQDEQTLQQKLPSTPKTNTPASLSQKANPSNGLKDSSYLHVLNYKKELAKQKIPKSIPGHNKTVSIQKDSLIENESNTNTVVFEEIRATKSKPVQEFSEIPQYIRSGDWMVGVLLFSIIALAWTRMKHRKLLLENTKAIFSVRDTIRLLSEQNAVAQRVFFIINMVFFFNLALFSYQLLSYFHLSVFDFGEITNYWALLAGIIAVYISRIGALKFLAFLFQQATLGKEIVYNLFTINRVVAFVLLPFIVAIPFVPENLEPFFIYSGITINSLLLIWQTIRNVQLFFMGNPSLFYTILYLCALEIVPVIVLIKYILSIQVNL